MYIRIYRCVDTFVVNSKRIKVYDAGRYTSDVFFEMKKNLQIHLHHKYIMITEHKQTELGSQYIAVVFGYATYERGHQKENQ